MYDTLGHLLRSGNPFAPDSSLLHYCRVVYALVAFALRTAGVLRVSQAADGEAGRTVSTQRAVAHLHDLESVSSSVVTYP
jgi:hypothetical protein